VVSGDDWKDENGVSGVPKKLGNAKSQVLLGAVRGDAAAFFAFFAGFVSDWEDDADACEAVRFLWLGSQRIFLRLQASQALMTRMR